MYTTTVLGEQTAINYAEALTNAVEDVKVLRKHMMDKRAKK
jgi:ribosomal protein S5